MVRQDMCPQILEGMGSPSFSEIPSLSEDRKIPNDRFNSLTLEGRTQWPRNSVLAHRQ